MQYCCELGMPFLPHLNDISMTSTEKKNSTLHDYYHVINLCMKNKLPKVSVT